MKKITLILIVICALLLVVVGVGILRAPKPVSPIESPQDTFPVRDGIFESSPVRDPVAVTQMPGDTTDAVFSDTKLADIVSQSTDLEYENEYIVADTEEFTVYLVSHAKHLWVILKNVPMEPGHRAAETYLANLLEVRPEVLCTLSINVFAPKSSEPTFSQHLGFSACPGPHEAKSY